MSTPESNGRHDPPEDDIEDENLEDYDLDLPDQDAEGRTELEIAFTPRQILGGFALLAALLLLLRRLVRRRGVGGPGGG